MQIMAGGGSWVIGGTLGGLIYGLIQNFGFKHKTSRGILWIILNALGWAGAYGLGNALPSDVTFERIAFMNVTVAKGMLG